MLPPSAGCDTAAAAAAAALLSAAVLVAAGCALVAIPASSQACGHVPRVNEQ